MRNALLLTFVLVCTAVVSIDRYLTNDAVNQCMDANLYNIRETARIKATSAAQQYATNHSVYLLETARMQAEENLRLANEADTMRETAKVLYEQNQILQKYIQKLMLELQKNQDKDKTT